MLFVLGVLADLTGFNRRLLEEILVSVKRSQLPRTADESTQRWFSHHADDEQGERFFGENSKSGGDR